MLHEIRSWGSYFKWQLAKIITLKQWNSKPGEN